MDVYILCDESRGEFFVDILETRFTPRFLAWGEFSGPAAGDVVLADLAGRPGDWKSLLAEMRNAWGGEMRILAVLHFEQIRALDHRVPLDDFVADGGTGEEIRARLRRMMRKEAGVPENDVGLVIDEDRYEVRAGGTSLELTFKEFELLRFLAARPGKVFTREVLLEQVWGYDYFGGARTVDVHIRRIRSKIEREGKAYIRTVRGVGYIFEHPPS